MGVCVNQSEFKYPYTIKTLIRMFGNFRDRPTRGKKSRDAEKGFRSTNEGVFRSLMPRGGDDLIPIEDPNEGNIMGYHDPDD